VRKTGVYLLASKPSWMVSGLPSVAPSALSPSSAQPARSRATASRSTISLANRLYGASGGGWLLTSNMSRVSSGEG
jgi:hypothetical protein